MPMERRPLSMILALFMPQTFAAETCFGEKDPVCDRIHCQEDFNFAFANCKLSCQFCKSENENIFTEPRNGFTFNAFV